MTKAKDLTLESLQTSEKKQMFKQSIVKNWEEQNNSGMN